MVGNYGKWIWEVDMLSGYGKWIWEVDMLSGYGRICMSLCRYGVLGKLLDMPYVVSASSPVS